MKQQIINDILQSPNNQLSNIITKVNQLHTLNQSLSEILDSKLAVHCQITNLENQILTLLVDNSSWGTKIRYAAPEIIKKMHTIPELSQVKQIKCIVRPKQQYRNAKLPQTAQKMTISSENAQILRSVANGIKDEKLKKALLKLVGTRPQIF
ncbi:MAG: DUF721 domain-containing protein [Gammaproteobacteria bacterium]|jgi:hypothetical protein